MPVVLKMLINMKKFFKYLAFLERERIKIMIHCGRPTSI